MQIHSRPASKEDKEKSQEKFEKKDCMKGNATKKTETKSINIVEQKTNVCCKSVAKLLV